MEPDRIHVESADPLDAPGDGLIHPVPCRDPGGAPWLEDFLEAVGPAIRDQLNEQLPLRIGNVAVTDGGDLAYVRIVHLPVQTAPGVPTTEKNLQVALRSALVAIDETDVDDVVIPSLIPPDQSGSLERDAVAETLIGDLLQYPPAHFVSVTLAGTDPDWTEAIRRVLADV